MSHEPRLKALFVTGSEHDDHGHGHGHGLAQACRDHGFEVIEADDHELGGVAAHGVADLHLIVVDANFPGGAGVVVAEIRKLSDDIPVFLSSEKESIADLDTVLISRVDGFIDPHSGTVEWQAGRMHEAAEKYHASLMPPMFGALVDFTETHEHSWHTPGHAGGEAYLKSPTGRLFWDHFGEALLRSDLSVSVAELGSLQSHDGPMGEAERAAARIFGSDITFFGTNGGSTSNRVVYASSVIADDVVLCGRNAHKSIEQAVTLTHAIPVYLLPTRNQLGIIGPILPSELDSATVRSKMEAHPLIQGAKTPTLATITNSTYDGLLYHVPTVERLLGESVDRLHFDEAWLGYASFNSMYDERHALHKTGRIDDAPTVFATQSAHKMLAALSQAAFLHVRQGRSPVDFTVLTEANMMHGTTSPLYPLIASSDVAARMMAGTSGRRLTQETIDEAIAFRQKMAQMKRDLGADWFFTCWQPDSVVDESGVTVAFADANPADLGTNPRHWLLDPEATWHGFAGLPEGYTMLDPIKVTIVTPGLRPDGEFDSWGIPAQLLTAYLAEHASVQVEKTQDYSILFLFSLGVSPGKWGSLITSLFEFKRDFDKNRPIREVLPLLWTQLPERVREGGLRDLADTMHEQIRVHDRMNALREAFSSQPKIVMRGADAYAALVRGDVERVSLSELAGRTLAIAVVPHPPGIPLYMPGESAGAEDSPALAYLRALEAFDREFPSFVHDIHGVEFVDGRYVVTCIKE